MPLFVQVAIVVFPVLTWTLLSRMGANGCIHDISAFLALLLWSFSSSTLEFLRYATLFILLFLGWKWLPNWPLNLLGDFWKVHVHEDTAQCWTPPLLYPSRTAHTRLVPKNHSFSYSYLTVGVPVTDRNVIVNKMLAVDTVYSSQAWYQVRSEDHLYRISSGTDLQRQLVEYLKLQGVKPETYPFAYLITAPRFLGYNFNPVSFWYLYSAEKKLTAMILEVNNTFDERRMYLLRPENAQRNDSGKIVPKLEEPERIVFTDSWAKDFHVSPFNDREGRYSLEAEDPLQQKWKCTRHAFRNTITLSTLKGDAKIIAEVFSTGSPLDPRTMTTCQRLKFVASWWWVGFVTFPRIVREAGKLFFLKSMQVWYRPEVNRGSIGRQSTHSEITVERFFRSYLKNRTKAFKDPTMSIRYTNPTPSNTLSGTLREELITFTQKLQDNEDEKNSKIIDFDVFTPFFFTHLVHYVHTIEAITACTVTAREENKLLHVSQPEILPQLFPTRASESKNISPSTTAQTPSVDLAKSPLPPIETPSSREDFEWRFLRYVRSQVPRPPAQAYPTVPDLCSVDSTVKRKEDIRPQPLSDLDRFVYYNYKAQDRALYRNAVIQTLEGSLLGFNMFTFLKVIDWPVRLWLLWMAATSIVQVYAGDISGFSEAVKVCAWVNSVNLLALFKGSVKFFVVRASV